MNTTWLKREGAIAKADGFYDARGRKLQGCKLTQAQVDDWNNTKPLREEYVPSAPMLTEADPIVEAPLLTEADPVEEVVEESKGFFKKKKKK